MNEKLDMFTASNVRKFVSVSIALVGSICVIIGVLVAFSYSSGNSGGLVFALIGFVLVLVGIAVFPLRKGV